MEWSYKAKSRLAVLVTGLALLVPASAMAETRVIEATDDVTWKSNGQESASGTPLVVDRLAPGDVIEVAIEGVVPHGFVTLNKDSSASDVSLVIACGEDEKAKPNAVIREVDCGPKSNFNKKYKGKMHLQMLDAFKADVPFWCVVHEGDMAGILRPKK
jgi:hypothetical protein